MSAVKPVSATVGKWLRENGWSLGGLTGQDWPALKAAAHIVELWCAADSSGRKYAAIAFRHVVESMQPTMRHLAYHAIAHVSDWSFRDQLWYQADLERLENPGLCAYEPGGSARG